MPARFLQEIFNRISGWFERIFPFLRSDPQIDALKFEGTILRSAVQSRATHVDLPAAAQIWFPKTAMDVAAALALARNLNTFIKSGRQAAANDAVDASGGVVINLAALNEVTVDGDLLKAEPAATVGDVAEKLTANGLVLPLADNRLKSIAANLTTAGPECLLRSLGPLSDYVVQVNAVTRAGKPTTLTGPTSVSRLQAEKLVATEITFKAAPAQNLRMTRTAFLYPGTDVVTAILRKLLIDSSIPPGCDVVLDAFSAMHDIPLIRITAIGNSAERKSQVDDLVNQALSLLPSQFPASEIMTEVQSGTNVLHSIVSAGYGVPFDPQVETERRHSIIEPANGLTPALEQAIGDIDLGLGFHPNGKGKRHKELRIFTRIQRNRDDKIVLSGFVYKTGRTRSRRPATADQISPLQLPAALESVVASLIAPQRIPGFRGDVFIPGDLLYELHSTQYATSSFPSDQMTPHMVAFPLDIHDVQAAIRFASAHRKSLVARSGGHQYCGLSSGGDSTIVLAMDAFNLFRIVASNVADAGPAVPLTDLAANFRDQGITIPHGECPLVCIGGHLQTGGYGHLARSYGLALDYVQEFTIVLADGSVRNVQRPSGAPTTDDGELFWGVLGGNAGSFGIIANYRIECLRDVDHPHSYGYTAIRQYEKARYKTLMKEAQKWTQEIAAGTLRSDIDFMMTVESSRAPFLPPVHLVELVYGNVAGAGETIDGDELFQTIIDATNDGPEIWNLLTNQGPTPLSELSNSFVRRFPMTTLDGREFRFPYKKRVNATNQPLTDEFIEKFVDKVDEVVEGTPGVSLVFQMMFGGGSFRNSSRRPETSIPHRDSLFTLVFDLFYDIGHEQDAIGLQNAMQAILDTHFNGPQEQRVFWGSFGDFNIAQPEIRNCYYDDLARYARLQQLKKTIDPTNLFHSPLTVTLPWTERLVVP